MNSASDERRLSPLLRSTAVIQGVFYLVTGLWPFVSLETFELVTGEKVDDWLVLTVGVLIIVTGTVLLVAVFRGGISFEVMLLAVGNALALAAIDIYFVSTGRIRPVYLLDAVAELVLAAMWGIGWFRTAR